MKRLAIAAASFVAVVVILVLVRHGEVGLWDWDTYGRIQFIHEYSAERYVDGHLLYHGLMRVLMATGFTDVGAVVVETALGMAAFLGLLGWICWRQGLSRPMTALVLVAATLGSPGLVALYLMVEDNVPYFVIVLAVYHLQSQAGGERRVVIQRGVALGSLFAVAMLINISLLVMPLAVIPAIPLVAVRDRDRALGLVVAIATTLAVYYAAHVIPFRHAQVALHEFLPQALGLRDFEKSTAPLLSLERFAQYRGGLRAISLTPAVHQMVVSDGLRWMLVELLPWLLAACAAALATVVAVTRGREVWGAALARLDLVATLGVSLVFPYFYEPSLIERWDVCWVGALFLLVPLLAKPTRLVLGLVAAMLVIQGFGTSVTIGHHYGVAWSDPRLAQARSVAREVVRRRGDVVVLPYTVDRAILADFAFRIGGQPRLYLMRDDGTCVRITYQAEDPVEASEVEGAVRTAKHPYVDPALSARLRWPG